MNNTAKYISDLLYRYECVIVPGFGAFLTRRQSAVISDNDTTFFPPKKIISFNSQLQNNDGLLANHIATAENISYTDAVAKIQRYTLYLHDKIKSGEKVKLQGIGSFYSSIENTLQFEAESENKFLTEAFGMSTFNSPVIKREVYKQDVERIEEKAPVLFTPEKRQEPWVTKYVGAAAIAFLVGIVGYSGLQLYEGDVANHNYTVRQNAAKDIDRKIQEATFEISNPLPAINLSFNKAENGNEATDNPAGDSKTENIGNYHIIAGAFRVKANALKKVRQLQQKGYHNSALIGKNKYGLHQVVYQSFSNRTEAINSLQDIKNTEDSKAWLFVE